MHIASYELYTIETGEFVLDGGAMFGIVPKALWEKKIPADNKNRITLRMRSLLISGNERNILVDTGIGNKDDALFQDIYKVDHSNFQFERSLSQHNLTCDDITDVILTHFHFDHAGGSTKFNEAGKVVPTFPNAYYFIQKENLTWAKDPSEKDQASFTRSTFEPLMEAGLLKELSGSGELFPGIEIIKVDGHTKAQQLVKIFDEEKTLLYCGDLIPTSAHISLPWIMSYDNHPLTTLNEKETILNQAYENKWILFFEHCPKIVACYVNKVGKGFKCGEEVEI